MILLVHGRMTLGFGFGFLGFLFVCCCCFVVVFFDFFFPQYHCFFSLDAVSLFLLVFSEFSFMQSGGGTGKISPQYLAVICTEFYLTALRSLQFMKISLNSNHIFQNTQSRLDSMPFSNFIITVSIQVPKLLIKIQTPG